MPRKTLQTLEHGFPITPYHLGPKLIDDSGDSVTEDAADAVRVLPVSDAGVDISQNITQLGPKLVGIKDALDENLEELKRIRLGHELHLWEQEVHL